MQIFCSTLDICNSLDLTESSDYLQAVCLTSSVHKRNKALQKHFDK